MTPTIWSLLYPDGALPAGASKDIEGSSAFDAMRRAAGRLTPAKFASMARPEVGDGMRQMLQIPVLDVLLRGWAVHQQLRQALAKQTDTTKTVVFSLGKHRITSRHRPRIELTLAEQPIGALPFDLTLTLEIEAATLHIQNRRVMKISTGKATAKASFKLGDVELPTPPEIEVPLPGEMDLREGIPLPL